MPSPKKLLVGPYSVYKVEFAGAPNHEALYIPDISRMHDTDIKGRLYHAAGCLFYGMKYESVPSYNPATSPIYLQNLTRRIGVIEPEDLQRFEEECCQAVIPPPGQLAHERRRQFPNEPLYFSGHWASKL